MQRSPWKVLRSAKAPMLPLSRGIREREPFTRTYLILIATEQVHNVHRDLPILQHQQSIINVAVGVGASLSFKLQGSETHNDEWRVVKPIFAIDVHAQTDEFLALAKIAMSTSQQKIVKFVGLVERVLIAQDAALDQGALLAELPLQFMLPEHHLGGQQAGILSLYNAIQEKKKSRTNACV